MFGMKKIKIGVGTDVREYQMPECWDELTQEQFVYAVSHMPAEDRLPVKVMQHLLGVAFEQAMFVMPTDWYVIHREGFKWLDDYEDISRWIVEEIRLKDGRRCLPPTADFDNVSWEEFLFADQLAQNGNWWAVAACLYRPEREVKSEETDGRVPFTRFGASNRLGMFRELDAPLIKAVEVNYLVLRKRLTDGFPNLFTTKSSGKGGESAGWPEVSRALLGERVWEEEQLMHTSAAQVLYRLDSVVKESKGGRHV